MRPPRAARSTRWGGQTAGAGLERDSRIGKGVPPQRHDLVRTPGRTVPDGLGVVASPRFPILGVRKHRKSDRSRKRRWISSGQTSPVRVRDAGPGYMLRMSFFIHQIGDAFRIDRGQATPRLISARPQPEWRYSRSRRVRDMRKALSVLESGGTSGSR